MRYIEGQHRRNEYIVNWKTCQCDIYVRWSPDKGFTWFTHQPVRVYFENGQDLLWKAHKVCSIKKWRCAKISAPDMCEYLNGKGNDFLTFKEELYASSGCSTVDKFAKSVNDFCEKSVNFVRNILEQPEREVRVKIRLDVTERDEEYWVKDVNWSHPDDRRRCRRVFSGEEGEAEDEADEADEAGEADKSGEEYESYESTESDESDESDDEY